MAWEGAVCSGFVECVVLVKHNEKINSLLSDECESAVDRL